MLKRTRRWRLWRVKRPHIKKGDVVVVLTGDDAGKTGRVLRVMPRQGRALVEGVNYVKKHLRKSQEHPQGGIVEKEAPVALSNLRRQTPAEARAAARGRGGTAARKAPAEKAPAGEKGRKPTKQ